MFFKNAPKPNKTSLFVLSILLLGTSSAWAMEDWTEGRPSHFVSIKEEKTNRGGVKKGGSETQERSQETWRVIKEKSKHKELTQEELNILLDHYLRVKNKRKNKELTKESDVSADHNTQKSPIDLKNPQSIYDFVETLLAKRKAFQRTPPAATREEMLDLLKHDLSLLDLPALQRMHELIRKITHDSDNTPEKANSISSKSLPSVKAQEMEDSDFEFYNQIRYLDNCLVFHDLNSQEKEEIHYAYYILGLRYFLGLRDYEKATIVFLNACSFHPQDAYIQLKSFLKYYFFTDHMDVPQRSPADHNKARELYQKGLEAINLKEKDYNLDHHEYLWSLSFLGQDFERARKHAEGYIKMASGKERRDMQSSLAQTLYRLKRYEEAEEYLSALGDLLPDDYTTLTHIYACKKDWKKAQECIVKAPGGFANEEDALILAELVMNIKSPEFNPLRHRYLKVIKESIPSIREEVDRLVRTKNKDKLRSLVKKGIAIQKLLESKQIYRNFDEQYKHSWIKASQTPEIHGDFLRSLDKIAKLIETTYQELRSFESEDPVVHCQSILDSFERLKSLSGEAELEFKQTTFNMARSPGNSDGTFKTSEDFEFPTTDGTLGNLKKEYAGKETSRRKKGNRGEKENTKDEHEKEKQISLAGKSEGSGKDEPSESRLRSFRNSETEDIWNSKDVRSYPKKALDLLDSLSQAHNMSELRELTPRGAKLEMLQGARAGQLSLRINDQWRICFEWVSGEGAHNIEIIDYH